MSLQPSTHVSTHPPRDIRLLDGTGALGWITGNRLGFTGFADTAEASAAAWIAHLALERRRAKRELEPAPQGERPPLYLARSGEHEWIEAPGKQLALLIRPESHAIANQANEPSAGWYGVEIVFPEDTPSLTMGSSAHVIYRGLRRSGLRWSIRAQNPRGTATAFKLEKAPPPAREVNVADPQGAVSRSSHVHWRIDDTVIDEGILNRRDIVDDAVSDSFPASDPPPWGGFRVGPPAPGPAHQPARAVRRQERQITGAHIATPALPIALLDTSNPVNRYHM